MYGDFFGEYLVQCKAITKDQLQKVIAYQKEHNQLMGKLAMDKEYLTYDQVQSLLKEQSSLQKKFGRLAQEKGFLSQKQIQELLQYQAENHICLGEALNRLGYLSIDQLNVYLNNFKREFQYDKKIFSQRIEEFPQRDLLWKGLEVVEDLFFRLGYVLKIKRALEDPPVSPQQPVFLMEQDFTGTGRALFGLQMSWNALSVISQDNAWYPSKDSNGSREVDIAAEIMHSLNYVLCEDLRLAGYKVKARAVRFELPQDCRKALGIRLYSMLGPVTMLYYFL